MEIVKTAAKKYITSNSLTSLKRMRLAAAATEIKKRAFEQEELIKNTTLSLYLGCMLQQKYNHVGVTYFALAGCLVFAALWSSSGSLWRWGPTWILPFEIKDHNEDFW